MAVPWSSVSGRAVAQEQRGHLQHAVDARRQQVAIVDEAPDAARGLPEQLDEVGNGQPVGLVGVGHVTSLPDARGSAEAVGPRGVATDSGTESADARRGR